MLGKDAPYVPGWDCHGLPIEWKIEEEYRDARARTRTRCRSPSSAASAATSPSTGSSVQRASSSASASSATGTTPTRRWPSPPRPAIVRELGKFLLNGGLYAGCEAGAVVGGREDRAGRGRGRVPRPHLDHGLGALPGRATPSRPELDGASVVIWTTTPWTMPGNRAIAYGADIDYALIEVDEVGEGSRARVGERLVLAARAAAAGSPRRRHRAPHDRRPRSRARRWPARSPRHPLRGQGYDFDVPLLPGDFVTAEPAPASSISRPATAPTTTSSAARNGLAVPDTVGRGRHLSPPCRCSPGMHVYKAGASRSMPTGAAIEAPAGCWRAARWCTPTRIPGAPRRR